MKYFLFHSKQDPALIKAEANSIINAWEGTVLKDDPEFMVVEASAFPDRLVLTSLVCEILTEGSLDDILSNIDPMEFKSFAVRCVKLQNASIDSKEVERRIGEKFNGTVNLKTPETVIRVFTNGLEFYVCKQLYEYKEKALKARDVNARPFFHPTSLQPKFARLLLNLGGVRKNFLDPFCGAGGILMEGAVLGLDATGVELDEKSYEGCKENLWFYHLDDVEVIHGDFLKVPLTKYECIVTDLPYGKSSLLFDRKLEQLYESAFVKMAELSGNAVIMAQTDLSDILEKTGWTVLQTFTMYVHKSMTRYIHVCSIQSR